MKQNNFINWCIDNKNSPDFGIIINLNELTYANILGQVFGYIYQKIQEKNSSR
jgi:hypothetical protein